jgi:hypothetical protein
MSGFLNLNDFQCALASEREKYETNMAQMELENARLRKSHQVLEYIELQKKYDELLAEHSRFVQNCTVAVEQVPPASMKGYLRDSLRHCSLHVRVPAAVDERMDNAISYVVVSHGKVIKVLEDRIAELEQRLIDQAWAKPWVETTRAETAAALEVVREPLTTLLPDMHGIEKELKWITDDFNVRSVEKKEPLTQLALAKDFTERCMEVCNRIKRKLRDGTAEMDVLRTRLRRDEGSASSSSSH